MGNWTNQAESNQIKSESTHLFSALCLLTFAASLFISGCGQPGSLAGEPKRISHESSKVPEVAQPQNQSEKNIKKVTQTITVRESNLSDVIIVIDNSASMRFEQSNMAERFSSLIDEMKDLDWRLGIITTDVSKDQPKKGGRFLEFAGLDGQDHLTSEMNPDVVRKAFAATIQRPAREGHANEQGIKATYWALQRKPEWLRANASLNVVVVTDADESPYKGTAEIRNNPSALLKYVQSENPSKSFFFHSIIVKEGDETCLKKDSNESYGRSYAWLSEKTGGVIGSVCEPDYSRQLKMIGEKVSQQIKSIELQCEPIPGSVLVKIAPDQLITDFMVEGRDLKLSNALPVGDTEIEYQCEVLDEGLN